MRGGSTRVSTRSCARAESMIAEGGVIGVQVLNEFPKVTRRKLRWKWEQSPHLSYTLEYFINVISNNQTDRQPPRMEMTAPTTRSTSEFVMVGKSGSVTIWRHTRSATGNIPSLKPILRYRVNKWMAA